MPAMSAEQVWAEATRLAEVTRTSGQVFPIQIKLLTGWIYGAVAGIRRPPRVEIEMDRWVVRYLVDVSDGTWPQPNLLRGLARSVRDLFRDEYDLEVVTKEWEFKDPAPHPERRTRSRIDRMLERGILSPKPSPSSPSGSGKRTSTSRKAP